MNKINAVLALRLGLITWFQYFEIMRDVPVDKRITFDQKKAA